MLLAVPDLLVAQWALDWGWFELLSLRRGEWFLSPVGYDFVVLTISGFVVGVLLHVALIPVRSRFDGAFLRRIHFSGCTLFLGAAIVAGRILAHTRVGTAALSRNQLIVASVAVLAVIGAAVVLAHVSLVPCLYQRKATILFGLGIPLVGLGGWLAQEIGMDLRISDLKAMEEIHEQSPNVLLVVLDTLRADAILVGDRYGDIAPHIRDFAGQGATFSNAFSVSAWTLPSHASMFTGLYPDQHGTGWQHQRLESRFVTLAESFSERDYQTVAISENPFVGESTGFAQGFADFYGMAFYDTVQEPAGMLIATVISRVLGLSRWTGEYTRSSIRRLETWLLDQRDPRRPFFGFVNLMAAHLPNYPRSQYGTSVIAEDALVRIEPVNQIPERHYLEKHRLSEDDLAVMHELYLGDVRFLDERLGEFFQFLSTTGELDRTVIVLTADHGENFGEHGLIEHQLCLYNTLLHVPLMVRYPAKVESGLVVREPVSTAFIPHTLEELLGVTLIETRPDAVQRSLFSPDGELFYQYGNPVEMLREVLEEEPAFDFSRFDREIDAISDGEFKLIRYSDGREELFNTIEDRGELRDMRSALPEEADRLRLHLDNWLDGLVVFESTQELPEMDEATAKALKALGYVN